MKVIWYNKRRTLERIAENKQLGTFIATSVAKHLDKYVPMRDGTLADTLEIEPFKITYIQPYAEKMYLGEGFNFSKDKHPLATAKWDKVGMQTERDAIVREINRFIKNEQI